jgi:HAE1 family hydrophobic/amphiphilic exporter-1
VIRRQIESLEGVGQVLVVGGRQRQINIRLDADRLRAYNVTVTDVSRALNLQNAETPGGRMDQGPQSVTLRTRGRVQTVQEFNDIVVKANQSHPVRIADVAEVEDGMADLDTIATLNGTSTVLLNVRRQSGTNTVQVAKDAKERIEEIKKALPAGYDLRIVRDGAEFIEASIHNVEEHLIVGSILAALVVLLFLTNLRSTLISAVAIPTSIIATFGLIWFMGFTLDTLTMLALTLSVGIVIDDAIVVLENITGSLKRSTKTRSGGDRRHEGNRPVRRHAVAGDDLRARRVHGRHRRPVHEELRPDDGVRDHGVAGRQLHADADAVGALSED